MSVSDIRADEALKSLLDGKVTIGENVLTVYGHCDMPNKGVGSDFIQILYNGNVSALTYPTGVFSGNLALEMYSRANSDNTAKKKRMRIALSQIESLINGKCSEGYFFRLSTNPITPITINENTGYGIAILNVEWREVH